MNLGLTENGSLQRLVLRRFYGHLVTFLAAEAAVLVIALATGSVARWCAAVLLVGGLSLGAHASTALRPIVGSRRRD